MFLLSTIDKSYRLSESRARSRIQIFYTLQWQHFHIKYQILFSGISQNTSHKYIWYVHRYKFAVSHWRLVVFGFCECTNVQTICVWVLCYGGDVPSVCFLFCVRCTSTRNSVEIGFRNKEIASTPKSAYSSTLACAPRYSQLYKM